MLVDMREWKLIGVVSGNFSVACDHCGSTCRKKYQTIQHRDTNAIMNVGTDCGWQLTGTRTRIEPKVIDDDSVPDWML